MEEDQVDGENLESEKGLNRDEADIDIRKVGISSITISYRFLH